MSSQQAEPQPTVPYSQPGTPAPQHQLGWIGLGAMGYSMAANLAKHLHSLQPPLPPLLVYNRTTSKSDKLKSECPPGSVKIASSIEEVGQACDTIFTSLSNDDAARAVYAELLKGEEKRNGTDAKHRRSLSPKTHTVFCDTSTLYPTTTGELERLVSALPRRQLVAGPVFGPPPMAKAASLVFAVAGTHASKKHLAQFMVPAMGRKVMDFGSDPERAASFKLIGNSLILSTIEMLAETMVLAEKTGVGADRFYEFIKEFFPAPSAIGYGGKILNHSYASDEGFTLDGGIKDASHIRRLGASVDCPLPIIDLAHQHLISARANTKPGETRDWSSLAGGVRIAAGLQPFSSSPMLHKE